MRKLLTWDFKETGLDKISDALSDFGLYLSDVIDTGSDEVAVVLSDEEMTDDEVELYWKESGL